MPTLGDAWIRFCCKCHWVTFFLPHLLNFVCFIHSQQSCCRKSVCHFYPATDLLWFFCTVETFWNWMQWKNVIGWNEKRIQNITWRFHVETKCKKLCARAENLVEVELSKFISRRFGDDFITGHCLPESKCWKFFYFQIFSSNTKTSKQNSNYPLNHTICIRKIPYSHNVCHKMQVAVSVATAATTTTKINS